MSINSAESIYLDNKPGRTVRVNGREHLFFSGYNYLGVNSDPEFLELVLEGISKYGWLFPSSRISNTRLAIYEECEELLSTITGSEASVLMSSGFNAGRLAIEGRSIKNSPSSHPAILKNPSAQQSFLEWTEVSDDPDFATIASDSVNPLSAAVYDFGFLNRVKHELTVILDDSHGIGIIGPNGEGISADTPKKSCLNYIYTYSLSKAFGISGGAISCSGEEAKRLRRLPAYTAATPLSPAHLFAFAQGQHIYRRQLGRLRANISLFGQAVQDLPGIHFHPTLPVFILDDRYPESALQEKGIIISSFAYPDPQGKKLNRIVVNALHSPSDLQQLAERLRQIQLEKASPLPK